MASRPRVSDVQQWQQQGVRGVKRGHSMQVINFVHNNHRAWYRQIKDAQSVAFSWMWEYYAFLQLLSKGNQYTCLLKEELKE